MANSTAYKSIDFLGKAITSAGSGSEVAITIPGIYDKIESSYKAILILNLNVDSHDFLPFIPIISVVSDDFIFDLSSDIVVSETENTTTTKLVKRIVTINDDDEIIVTKIEATF